MHTNFGMFDFGFFDELGWVDEWMKKAKAKKEGKKGFFLRAKIALVFLHP